MVVSSESSRAESNSGVPLCRQPSVSLSLSFSLFLGQCHVPVRAACSAPALVSIVMLGGKRVGGKGGKLQEGRGEGEKARKCVKKRTGIGWLESARKRKDGRESKGTGMQPVAVADQRGRT